MLYKNHERVQGEEIVYNTRGYDMKKPQPFILSIER
jgi:hypothetical protein